MKLIVDAAYHQDKIDFGLLRPFVDGFIFRANYGTFADPKFVEHVNRAVDAGFKHIGLYSFLRPDQDIKAQIDVMRGQYNKVPFIRFTSSDQEQHGHTYLNLPPYYSPDKLSSLGHQHIEALATLGLRQSIYTRTTWVDSYAKPAYKWMQDYTVWLASWPYKTGVVYTDWQTLIDVYAPKAFAPYRTAESKKYALNVGLWQWSGDKFTLPGIYGAGGKLSAVDLNFVSDDIFSLMETGTYSPPPTEEAHEIWKNNLAVLSMVVRDAPTTKGTDTKERIKLGQTFPVYEKKTADGYTWGRIDPTVSKWVALKWSAKV
jgi:hypothetical protein